MLLSIAMSVLFRLSTFAALALAFPALAQQAPIPLTAPGAPAPATTAAPAAKPAAATKPKPAPKPASQKAAAQKPAPKPATAPVVSSTGIPTIGATLSDDQQRQEQAAAYVIEQRVAYRQTVQSDLATREGLLKQYETNYKASEAKMKATHERLLKTAQAVQDAKAAEAAAQAKAAEGVAPEAPAEGEEAAEAPPAAPAVDPAQVALLSKSLEQQSFDLMVQRRQMDSLRSDVTRLKELMARLSK
jgi:DNA polymerase III gamma/tau subunit